MKTVYFYLRFTINLIKTSFKEIKLNSLKKHKTIEELEAYVLTTALNWSNFVLKIAGLNLTVVGKENIPNEPCLFVGNHQSNLDIPAILSNMNRLTGAVAKKEMEKIPVISYWMREIHCVFMNREDPREALKAISEGIENLKNGYSMIIFPEGTRSKSNIMGEFKKGSMRLAIKAGVPIVPITFYDTHKAMEGNNGWVKKTNAKLIIDKPIYMDKMSKQEKAEISEVVKNIIQTNINNENKSK